MVFSGYRNTQALETYADISLLGLTPMQCGAIADGVCGDSLEERVKKAFNEKYEAAYKSISNPLLYEEKQDWEFATKWLLRLNMHEDTQLNRFFDFGIWEERSLEHICPKSRVGHKDENGQWLDGNGNTKSEGEFLLKRDEIEREGGGSEHGIGNLVLFYRNENTELGAKNYEEKIKMFFDPKNGFRSRHLVHTVSVFAIPREFSAKSISENFRGTLETFEETYRATMEACNE